MIVCPYCAAEVSEIGPKWDTDPHGLHMCDECGVLLEQAWKMCYNCNEYGLVERESGAIICADCGHSVSREEASTEHRVASSAEYMDESEEE